MLYVAGSAVNHPKLLKQFRLYKLVHARTGYRLNAGFNLLITLTDPLERVQIFFKRDSGYS
jgi:hypothetical protein